MTRLSRLRQLAGRAGITCMLAGGFLVSAVAEEAKTSSATAAPDPCDARLFQAPAAERVADAGRWGPLALLVGPAWVSLREGSDSLSLLYRYEWVDEGRALRRTQEFPSSPMLNTVTLLVPSAEAGKWEGCRIIPKLHDKKVRMTLRQTAADTVTSDWWTLRMLMLIAAHGREQIRPLRDGTLEMRTVGSTDSTRPELGPPVRFQPVALADLPKLEPAFRQERADFKAEVQRLMDEEAVRRKEKSRAFWRGLAEGAVAVSTGVAAAYAGQQGGAAPPAASVPTAGAGARPSAAASARPTRTERFEYQCAYGTKLSIDIPYKTEACLRVKKDFTVTFACNDVDRMASAAAACEAACGNRACDER